MEEQVTIPVGEVRLEGLLSLRAPVPEIGVVVCHPHPLYGGDMHNNVVAELVHAFQVAGATTLRFNFRGAGGSTGVHDDGIGEQQDVKAAVEFLLKRQAVQRIVVAGYSFGSMVGLRAGAADPRVRELIAVALPIARRDAAFLESVAKPKLLISGNRDDLSPVAGLEQLMGRIPEPKSLVVIDGADHFFQGLEHRAAAAAVAFVAGQSR